MPEWLTSLLPFGLPALKIIGVIGAFFGLAEARKREAVGGKRLFLPALSFLFVAVAAEVYDAFLKQRDGREMAYRFERLIHPLGKIRISMGYTLPLDTPGLVSYQSDYLRWQKSDDYSPFPPPKDNASANLLWFFPQATIFFFRHPTNIIRRDGRTDFGGEPDMTITPITATPPSPDRDPRKKRLISEYALDQRTFGYGKDMVEINIAGLIDDPYDRYSNGESVSTVDLVGAQIITQVCPYFLDPVTDVVPRSYRLSRLLLTFPGRQEIHIKEKDLERHEEVVDKCSIYTYNLPKTKEALSSMLNED